MANIVGWQKVLSVHSMHGNNTHSLELLGFAWISHNVEASKEHIQNQASMINGDVYDG